MNAKEIDRYQIAVVNSGTSVAVILFNSQGCRAKTSIDRKTRQIRFADAQNIPMPSNFELLEDEAIDLKPHFHRSLLGAGTPEGVILDAAFNFVMTTDALDYDEPNVETEDYDVVLRASSDIRIPDGAPKNTPRSGSATAGPARPKRRKTEHRVWI